MNSIVKKQNKQSKRKGRQLDHRHLQKFRNYLEDLPRKKEFLIEALHLIQDKYHYLSAKHLVALAHELKLSSAEVYEVATFYHHFDVIKESDLNGNDKAPLRLLRFVYVIQSPAKCQVQKNFQMHSRRHH